MSPYTRAVDAAKAAAGAQGHTVGRPWVRGLVCELACEVESCGCRVIITFAGVAPRAIGSALELACIGGVKLPAPVDARTPYGRHFDTPAPVVERVAVPAGVKS